MHGNHLKHMLVGGAGLFVVLLLAGVPLATAATYAVALACPLMMIFMMVGMGAHSGHGHAGHDHDASERPHATTSDTGSNSDVETRLR